MNLCRYSDGITCEIPLKLPTLNQYVNACRANRYLGANMKRCAENNIAVFLNKLPAFENPVFIEFTWVEKNRRRDLDNVAFAKKFILDALIKTGKLKNDNSKCVVGFSDQFMIGDESKVILKIMEV